MPVSWPQSFGHSYFALLWSTTAFSVNLLKLESCPVQTVDRTLQVYSAAQGMQMKDTNVSC